MGSAGQTLPISDTSSEDGTDRHPRKQLQMEPGPAAASTHPAAQPPVGGPSLPAVAAATAAGVMAPGAAAPSPPGWPGATFPPALLTPVTAPPHFLAPRA
eukprot:EG_transcript_23763